MRRILDCGFQKLFLQGKTGNLLQTYIVAVGSKKIGGVEKSYNETLRYRSLLLSSLLQMYVGGGGGVQRTIFHHSIDEFSLKDVGLAWKTFHFKLKSINCEA